MNYTYAWLVIAAAGVLGSLGLYFLTRSWRPGVLRSVVRITPLLLMVVPAPVPNFDGQFAPAFIVLLFEGLFQGEGKPLPALFILLAALAFGVLVGIFFGRRRRVEPVEEGSATN